MIYGGGPIHRPIHDELASHELRADLELGESQLMIGFRQKPDNRLL